MNSAGPNVVDTVAAVSELVDLFSNLPSEPPSLYIDIEGINLSRHGSISIIQIFILPQNQTYLIDIHTLGQLAFTTPSANGTTFKMVLESRDILKAFFDVRNDSDALYNHFSIHLAGIHDIQLLELAARNFPRRCINGLARCIERDAQLTMYEATEWKRAKDRGRMLFAPERGGSYDVFNHRPLSEDIIKYCAQDVQILPRLWQVYHTKLGCRWKAKVEAAVKDRINVCLQANYTGVGRHMTMAPAGWA